MVSFQTLEENQQNAQTTWFSFGNWSLFYDWENKKGQNQIKKHKILIVQQWKGTKSKSALTKVRKGNFI